MELSKENKRKAYIIGAIIIVLFVVGLMLKFWLYTIVAVGCFIAGYLYGRNGRIGDARGGKTTFLK